MKLTYANLPEQAKVELIGEDGSQTLTLEQLKNI
jgi:hypothetical protein